MLAQILLFTAFTNAQIHLSLESTSRLNKRGIILATELTTNTTLFLSFFGKLQVGTPIQKLDILFNTNSPNSWVKALNCNDVTKCITSSTRFNSSNSTTILIKNGSSLINDNGRYIDGRLINDYVTFGNGKTRFDFIEASNSANSVLPGEIGLMKYGVNTPTFIDSLKSIVNSSIDDRVFSFWIDETNEIAELIFGGVDTNRYIGEIKWIPSLNSSQSWTIFMGDIRFIGSNAITSRISVGAQFSATFDTSTTFAVMPKLLAKQLNQRIGAILFQEISSDVGEFYTVSCVKVSSLPTIEFSFGDSTSPVIASITPNEYMIPIGSYCLSAFVGQDVDHFIVGNSILRRWYAVFDMDNSRVGLAIAIRTSILAGTVSRNLTLYKREFGEDQDLMYYNGARGYFGVLFLVLVFFFL